jgi:hypothetical protein
MVKMILINKLDKKRLEEAGLWKHRQTGKNSQESNFSVCNKQHNSRSKTYYVVEHTETMRFLEIWDKANVMKISEEQFNKLKNKKILNSNNIQTYNNYIPNAKGFIANNGDKYVTKEKKILLALNN